MRFIACFLLLIASFATRAQLNNRVLEQELAVDSTREKKIGVGVHLFTFVKNNEYFGPIADGSTLWGWQLNPQLTYQPATNVLLTGGIFIKYDLGREPFTKLLPTLTLKIRHRSWDYLIGTLDGSVSHRLVEPLYNFERIINARVENGLQARHVSDRLLMDAWVSYPQATGPGEAQQERFWGGVSLEKTLQNKPNFALKWPLQVTAFHEGGQNLSATFPVRSAFHLSTGLTLEWTFRHPFWKRIRWENHVLGFTEIADQNTNGWAFYPNLTVDSRPFSWMVSYWHGNGFVADYGGDLYQSVSRKFGNTTYRESKRNLLLLRILKDIKVLENLSISARFEPYFDFNNGLFEHSEGLYATYSFR